MYMNFSNDVQEEGFYNTFFFNIKSGIEDKKY